MKNKHKVTHKERVAMVKEYAENNKLYTLIAVILCIYIGASLISGKIHKRNNAEQPSSSQSEQVSEDEEADTNVNSENKKKELPKWRFYSIDLWILLGGGGFCMIKIMQEKRRAKEEFK